MYFRTRVPSRQQLSIVANRGRCYPSSAGRGRSTIRMGNTCAPPQTRAPTEEPNPINPHGAAALGPPPSYKVSWPARGPPARSSSSFRKRGHTVLATTCPPPAATDSHRSTTRAASSYPRSVCILVHPQDMVECIRASVIGKDAMIETPFGNRV